MHTRRRFCTSMSRRVAVRMSSRACVFTFATPPSNHQVHPPSMYMLVFWSVPFSMSLFFIENFYHILHLFVLAFNTVFTLEQLHIENGQTCVLHIVHIWIGIAEYHHHHADRLLDPRRAACARCFCLLPQLTQTKLEWCWWICALIRHTCAPTIVYIHMFIISMLVVHNERNAC